MYDSKVAREILDEINNSKSILLHCHPHPDPDSIGSSLAMMHVLNSLGKKVTVISGDDEIGSGFSVLPGIDKVVKKNFLEVDQKDFDLFIILDSAQPEMVTKKGSFVTLDSLKTIVIDHHATNGKFGKINLIDSSKCATAELLYVIFKEWQEDKGILIDQNVALNLLIGIWFDSGGLSYGNSTPETFGICEELAKLAPDYYRALFNISNSNSESSVKLLGLGLNNIKVFGNGPKIAVSVITRKDLDSIGIKKSEISAHNIVPVLRSVVGWDVIAVFLEEEAGITKASFRTRDMSKYDVSLLAKELGGGGHRGASGAFMKVPPDIALEKLVSSFEKLFLV